MAKFNTENIAGINEATVEELLRVEAQAKRLENEMSVLVESGNVNDDQIETFKWYQTVQFKIDYRLKQIGERNKNEWEGLFS